MTGSFHGNENEGMVMSPTDELRPGYGNGIWLLRVGSLQTQIKGNKWLRQIYAIDE